MTNVVEFPPRPSPPSHGSEDRGERAEALRRRIAERPALSPSDQEQIAKNLFRTLAQLERDGRLRRADLCREAFGSTPEESTKRLRQYTLDPAKEGEAREKALTALAKKATTYVKLADQAARMVGDDPDAAILDLVHGTTLVQDASVQAVDPLTRDLRAPVFRALERMTDAIARRTDLHRTFQLMARYPTRDRDDLNDGSLDVPDDATDITAGPVNDVLPILEDGAATPEDRKSVRGWLRLAVGAPAVLVGEAVLNETSEELSPKRLMELRPDDEPFEPRPGEKWSATLVFRLQVWLGIFPFGEAHEPRPGLRLEFVKHVTLHHKAAATDELFPPHEPTRDGESDQDRRIHEMKQIQRWMIAQPDWNGLDRGYVDLGRSPIAERLELRSRDFKAQLTIDPKRFLKRLGAVVTPLLGRSIKGGENRVVRIAALNSDLCAKVLDMRDCETISDWVGPLPEVRYDDGFRWPEPDPPESYRGEAEDYEPYTQEQQANLRYRFRFYDRELFWKQHERHVQGWSAGTLGYKLERSLLEIEGDDSVASQLEAQARALTERVQRDIGEALRRREARLSRLGRGKA